MLITVVTPTFNEQDNIEKVYESVKNVFKEIPDVNIIIYLLTMHRKTTLKIF